MSAHKEPTKLERNELFAQLANVSSISTSEDTSFWAIFGTFWAATALLLVALFSQGDFPKSRAVGTIISLSGVLVSILWLCIQYRSMGYLKKWFSLMSAIERSGLNIPDQYAISGAQHFHQHVRGLSARYLVMIVIWLVLVCRLLAAAHFMGVCV